MKTGKDTIEVTISPGVPQGSVKDHTMWNVEYDGLLRMLLLMVILAVAKSTQELELKCTDTLDLICNWMNDYGLELTLKFDY